MTEPLDQNIQLRIDGPIARVTLNRSDRHNAFDDRVIAALSACFDNLATNETVRVVILASTGKSFSAGADLGWMKRSAGYRNAENEADARKLAEMLAKLNLLPKPTIALVQGGAYGGGVGLVAACDIALAAEGAKFSLTETRLGLIPSVISPYVLAAIGARAARRYFLTAEFFDAAEAYRLGLVHSVVPADELTEAGDRLIKHLLDAAPGAVADAKRLIADIAGQPIDDTIIGETARRIANARSSDEGREGISAFLERRKPGWRLEKD
jgi:methylglutaconyl-CoA hydratase